MPGLSKGNLQGKFNRRWEATIGEHVIALRWSPDRAWLAAAAVGGPITIFEQATGKVAQTLAGHGFGTTAISWHPTEKGILASSGQDGHVRIWNIQGDTSEKPLAWKAGTSWVERVAWSPDGRFLAAAAGRFLHLWDRQGQPVRQYPAHPNTISDLQWQPGKNILATSTYGYVQLWSPEKDQPLQSFQWKGSTLVLAWSPDGKYLATGDQDCTVHFWIVAKAEDLQMSGYATKVRELSWDCTSRFLVTGGGSIPCVWDCSGKGPAGTKPLMFEAHEHPVSAVAFQTKGPLLATADSAGHLALWHPGKFKKALTERNFDGGITQLAWSAEDQYLAIGTETGQVLVLSLF